MDPPAIVHDGSANAEAARQKNTQTSRTKPEGQLVYEDPSRDLSTRICGRKQTRFERDLAGAGRSLAMVRKTGIQKMMDAQVASLLTSVEVAATEQERKLTAELKKERREKYDEAVKSILAEDAIDQKSQQQRRKLIRQQMHHELYEIAVQTELETNDRIAAETQRVERDFSIAYQRWHGTLEAERHQHHQRAALELMKDDADYLHEHITETSRCKTLRVKRFVNDMQQRAVQDELWLEGHSLHWQLVAELARSETAMLKESMVICGQLASDPRSQMSDRAAQFGGVGSRRANWEKADDDDQVVQRRSQRDVSSNT